MKTPSSSFTCEEQLLEFLIDGDQASQDARDHVASCPDCRPRLRHFQQLVAETREYLTPSGLQIQRIRATVRDKLDAKVTRGCTWQSGWTFAAILGCFIIVTMILPYRFPPVAQVALNDSLEYDGGESLEVMADQLLPGTVASEPMWVSALISGVMENESMEQIDEMIDLVIPDTGEQT